MTRPLLRFDPATGVEKPYPSESEQYRDYHGNVAWLYNPYTGNLRDARDVGSDTYGHLIAPVYKNQLPAVPQTSDIPKVVPELVKFKDGVLVPVDQYDPQNFTISTYHPTGNSGWINRAAYAVRVTHAPTGLSACCETERSQHANKAKAFTQLIDMLQARSLKGERNE